MAKSTETYVIVVLANEPEVFTGKTYGYRCADNAEVMFVNEHNSEQCQGLPVKAVVTVGEVCKENLAKFESLIRE